MSIKKPDEIVEVSLVAAEGKAAAPFGRLAVLGFLAGAFIALAAQGSTMAGFNLLAGADTYGLGRVLVGSVFTVGLMLVVLAGGELFTGNVLMVGALASRRIKLSGLLRNWLIVYAFNLLGSVFVAYLIFRSGLLDSGGEMLGAMTVKIAAGKTALSGEKAFILGILCNWLVCLAVWIAFAADSVAGKVWGIFFPIWLFVTSGFEHSVANMYYIPAGLFAKSVQVADGLSYADRAVADLHLAQSTLDGLTWGSFFANNLLPVTLGNIVGGGLFVSLAYLYSYRKKAV
ncbi:MAG: formate/nitrite transporter family protein [Clostridiales Family XIII bacterium]|jgi:formate/nitrite transporter|nr:formate/nitrite transporter family protein [Clostridiales Family XIII bacterium]